MPRVGDAKAVFERLRREQAEAEAARDAASRELARPSTRQALKGERVDPARD